MGAYEGLEERGGAGDGRGVCDKFCDAMKA